MRSKADTEETRLNMSIAQTDRAKPSLWRLLGSAIRDTSSLFKIQVIVVKGGMINVSFSRAAEPEVQAMVEFLDIGKEGTMYRIGWNSATNSAVGGRISEGEGVQGGG